MSLDIIEASKQFLSSYLQGKSCEYEINHPWRKDSTSVILHSLRVLSYVTDILQDEKVNLSTTDILIIQVSAILHDIGKCDVIENHANQSVKIIDKWLKENPNISSRIHDTEKLLRIIGIHSDKDKPENDLCSAILKDADILDEIGVLSIFMASNRIYRYSPFFFNELCDRLQVYEINYCDNQMSKLHTLRAKKILQDKIEFIKSFIKQLNSELEGTEELYRILSETYVEASAAKRDHIN